MLGKYEMRGLGLDITSIVGTTAETEAVIKKVLPTVEDIANDYEDIRPGIHFLRDYWYTVLAAMFFFSAAGAATGAWVVLQGKK